MFSELTHEGEYAYVIGLADPNMGWDVHLSNRCTVGSRWALTTSVGPRSSWIAQDWFNSLPSSACRLELKLDAAVTLSRCYYSSHLRDIQTMPLQHSPDPAEPSWAQDVKTEYLIFFSSRDESGKLWCPVRASPPKA